jgi:hypothetical protein
MLFKILADIVVVIHLLWILFLICGAFWGAQQKTVRIVHLSGLVFALILQVFNWYCPLTHLEVWLRAHHDPSLTYSGSFIIYYLEKIIYIELSRGLIFILSILLFVFNTWVYFRMKRDGKIRK